jgi:GNAT superfamily N-acetyltransferase|nr:GNAT family N-acetyltransferase [Kofleriaceae bacterium]
MRYRRTATRRLPTPAGTPAAHVRALATGLDFAYRDRVARIATLDRTALDAARAVLAAACTHDRAAEVAAEKLFGDGPNGAAAHAFAAHDDAGRLVGAAAVSGRYLRVLAIAPDARGRGAGSALLAACEDHARAAGESRLRALDQPGNYLAPGIDDANLDTLAWLARRGWQRGADTRENILVAVRDNPRVTPARAATAAAAASSQGYEIRRARADERALVDAAAAEFGGAWPFELSRALAHAEPGVHVAVKDGAYCAFAAHDGNNQGLGWFGPTGTWPAHRGRGLGEALLLACLVDVARDHARCEVAWIGPRPFYDKVAGVVADRRFAVMTKELRT